MGNDELSARARLRVDTTLKGKYRLDAVLGVGGMAAVYAATHRNRNRVAVKVLHPELAVDASLRARFVREGYVANTVEHSGTVRVLDDDVDDDGSVFLVMELLEGETLEARWERCGRVLAPQEVARYTRDVLDVLIAAHGKGIVHRDIKPENLFLTGDGTLKVLDFGIARLREASPSATRSGHVLGTPAFMPPEQALGRVGEVDALSDVWAAGATAFTLLSGHLVHEGQTPEEIMIRAATTHARRLVAVAPSVPPDLADAIDRALAYEKRDRWSSAQAMRDAVSYVLDVDAYWSSARPHEPDDNAKTQLAAPLHMTARSEIDEPPTLPPQRPATPPVTRALAALPSSTIAGVAARPATSRIHSRYAVAAGGGIAAALVVIGVVAGRAGANRTAPASPLAPSAVSSVIDAPTITVPSAASEAVEVVAVDSLPRAAPPVLDAAAASPTSTEPTKSVAPIAPTQAATTGTGPPRATDTKAKCDPPFTVDKTGVKRWKLECL